MRCADNKVPSQWLPLCERGREKERLCVQGLNMMYWKGKWTHAQFRWEDDIEKKKEKKKKDLTYLEK